MPLNFFCMFFSSWLIFESENAIKPDTPFACRAGLRLLQALGSTMLLLSWPD